MAKRKLFKRVALGLSMLIVLGLAGLFFGLNYIICDAVQQQTSASLDVKTTLESADLSIMGGKITLSGLAICSPEPYTADHVFTLGSTSVEVNYDQLRGNPIHIKRIVIDNPDLFIEQHDFTLNLVALSKRIPRPPQTSGGQPTQPVKLIIDELDVNQSKVTFLPGLSGLSKQIEVDVPSIKIMNIGTDASATNGKAIKDVVLQICSAIASKAQSLGKLPVDLSKSLNAQLEQASQQVGQHVEAHAQTLSEKMRETAPRIGQQFHQGIERILGRQSQPADEQAQKASDSQ